MSSQPSHQNVRLFRGNHRSPADGACVMELASILAGEPFSDRPRAVCRVAAAYLRALNDDLDDDTRHALYPYASAAVGTAGGVALERRRANRCRMKHRELRGSTGAIGRVIGMTLGSPAKSTPKLEHFAQSLVRAFRRTGRGWEARALAFADELIAMSAPAGPLPSGWAVLEARPEPGGVEDPAAPVSA